MHKITYSKGEIEYIESERVGELYEKIQKRAFVMIGENIRDTITIKSVVKMTDDEVLAYDILKEENILIQNKVKDEIKVYYGRLTSGVIKAMIKKYK